MQFSKLLACLLASCILLSVPQGYVCGDDLLKNISDEELITLLAGSYDDTEGESIDESDGGYMPPPVQSGLSIQEPMPLLNPRVLPVPKLFFSTASSVAGTYQPSSPVSASSGSSVYGPETRSAVPTPVYAPAVYGYTVEGSGYGPNVGRRKTLSSGRTGGKCYCNYDLETASWRTDVPSCREALYKSCDRDASMPCRDLDKYYTAKLRHSGAGHEQAALEQQISAFLKKDCSPPAPCTCSRLQYDNTDSAAGVFNCCNELSAHCKLPFSGLNCDVVHSFCQRNTHRRDVLEWVVNATKIADCPAPGPKSSPVGDLAALVHAWLLSSRHSVPLLLMAGAIGGCLGSVITIAFIVVSRRSTPEPAEFLSA